MGNNLEACKKTQDTRSQAQTVRSVFQKNKSDVTLTDFKIIKVLGQGTFGKVFLVEKNEPQARHFAMKAIRKEFVMENNQYDHIMNER